MPNLSPIEIGRKINDLGLWDTLLRYNWAIKPSGIVFPYFCVVLAADAEGSKVYHFMMLEGWQTMHDFIRTRANNSFGFYSSPMEMPHFELLIVDGDVIAVTRHEPGFIPRSINAAEENIVSRLLWETYGIAMRLEAESALPLKYAAERALFARVEDRDGNWSDAPMQIAEPRPHVERVAFAKADISSAKDLPFATDETVEIDFRLMLGVSTSEPRPRCCYDLVMLDSATGMAFVRERAVPSAEGGLRALWEAMPSRVLKHLIARGRIPGNVKVLSQRMFRLLRALGIELPIKLSLHDSLPQLDKVFAIPTQKKPE